jgi:hypothetical protein
LLDALQTTIVNDINSKPRCEYSKYHIKGFLYQHRSHNLWTNLASLPTLASR